MKFTVRELVSINNNPLVNWKINGDFYNTKKNIPEYLLDQYVLDWEADFWDAKIEITTEYHK